MGKGRLEAFSDGVIAVIITIMVLELKTPADGSFAALLRLEHPLLNYILSFLVVAIVWVNHHHLLSRIARVNAKVLWANTALLFWLSLIPLATSYLGESRAAPVAVAAYGAVLALSTGSFTFLQHLIMQQRKHEGDLARHGRRVKLKNVIGVSLYTASVPLAFVSVYASFAIFILIPLAYFIPDRKLEELAAASAE
jgi:TMEM175 potassium channel family protein